MNPEPRPFDMDTVVSEVEERLAAYDDLIENNTRRIAILEAMAQAIYREWFVEFRYPGCEKAKKKVVVDDAQAAEAARWLSENEDDTAV